MAFVGVGGKQLAFALNEGRSPCRVLAVEEHGLTFIFKGFLWLPGRRELQ